MWIASPSPSTEREDDEAEVDEHELADGRTVLKGADGTLYDYASFEAIGKWNKADNTLIDASAPTPRSGSPGAREAMAQMELKGPIGYGKGYGKLSGAKGYGKDGDGKDGYGGYGKDGYGGRSGGQVTPKGKGKGGIKGDCWGCGKPGHRQAECPGPNVDEITDGPGQGGDNEQQQQPQRQLGHAPQQATAQALKSHF